jgi:hypothetical protein
LIGETSGLGQQQFLMRRSSMTEPTEESKCHRYELVHGDDADFVAYRRHRGDGVWQTYATWMIPRTA